MALITRIGRLFRADFNAVLDRIEEPEVVLKQALREMQDALHSDKQILKILLKEYSLTEKNIVDLRQNIERVNDELDVCFDSNETELARGQVKRKLEIQHFEKQLNSKLNITDEKLDELKSRINENESRFSSMQQKFELLNNEKSNINTDEFFESSSATIDDNEVEIAFLLEKQARSTS